MNRRDFLRMIGLGCLVAVLPKVKPEKKNPFCDSTLEVSRNDESCTRIPRQLTTVSIPKELLDDSVLTYEDLYKFMNRSRCPQQPYTLFGYPIKYLEEVDDGEL